MPKILFIFSAKVSLPCTLCAWPNALLTDFPVRKILLLRCLSGPPLNVAVAQPFSVFGLHTFLDWPTYQPSTGFAAYSVGCGRHCISILPTVLAKDGYSCRWWGCLSDDMTWWVWHNLPHYGDFHIHVHLVSHDQRFQAWQRSQHTNGCSSSRIECPSLSPESTGPAPWFTHWSLL